ncbi:MAG: XTP/dITP diphosphatase [Thermofilum sp.]
MRVYIVTGNRGKFLEMAEVLARSKIEAVQLSLKKLEVQSKSLEEIARVAAEHLPPLDAPAVVEDAGLFVEALKGFPGPFSHYVYETIGCRGLLKLMRGVENRAATFKSAIALRLPGGEILVFTGEARGTITHEERGTGGFGFDPIFQPEGQAKTFAEMTLEEKNLYSHRGAAARKLSAWLTERYSKK